MISSTFQDENPQPYVLSLEAMAERGKQTGLLARCLHAGRPRSWNSGPSLRKERFLRDINAEDSEDGVREEQPC